MARQLHLVDSQAFPLVLPSAPRLCEGAYSAEERYTLADLRGLQVRQRSCFFSCKNDYLATKLGSGRTVLGRKLERERPCCWLELQRYAAARGVRLIGEIDTPGHGAAWCAGMPELCPDPPSCLQPLDVSNNATFLTIEAVLKVSEKNRIDRDTSY